MASGSQDLGRPRACRRSCAVGLRLAAQPLVAEARRRLVARVELSCALIVSTKVVGMPRLVLEERLLVIRRLRCLMERAPLEQTLSMALIDGELPTPKRSGARIFLAGRQEGYGPLCRCRRVPWAPTVRHDT